MRQNVDDQNLETGLLPVRDSQKSTQGDDEEIQVNRLSGDGTTNCQETINTSMLGNQDQKVSLFLSGISVTKSMVGVGILGLPSVAKSFGILPMMLLVLFVFGCTNFSSYLLIRSKNMCGHSNYTTIGHYLYEGKATIILMNLIIVIDNLGTCLGMLIIFGTSSENLVGIYYDQKNIPFYFERWFLIVLVGILLIPLVTVKSIEKLKFVSLIAVTSLTSFSIIIIYNFITLLKNGNLATDYALFPEEFSFSQAFSALPNIIFAFNWHFNQFPIYKGMVNPSDARIQKSAWMGTSLGTLLYLIVGILGYMTYGSKVQTNFLITIQFEDVGKPLYIFLNIAFTLSTTLTIPLLFYGSRNNCISIINLFKRGDIVAAAVMDVNESPLRKTKDEKRKIKQYETIRFYVTSIVLEVMLVIGAIYLTQLQVVFNLLGAVTSNAVSAAMPTLFFFKCVDKLKDKSKFNTNQKQLYYIVKGYFCYSLILVVVCVGSEILQISQGGG